MRTFPSETEETLTRLVEESLLTLNDVDQRIQVLRNGLAAFVPFLAYPTTGPGVGPVGLLRAAPGAFPAPFPLTPGAGFSPGPGPIAPPRIGSAPVLGGTAAAGFGSLLPFGWPGGAGGPVSRGALAPAVASGGFGSPAPPLGLGIFAPPLAPFGDLAGGLGAGTWAARAPGGIRPGPRTPTMDLFDEGKEFVVQVEVPGVRREDLDVTVNERILNLRATTRPDHDPKGIVHGERSDRGVVEYLRTIPLPAEIDAAHVKATFRDGILTLVVPKKNPTEGTRKIEVVAEKTG